MQIICAWCNKLLGEKPPYGGINNMYSEETTHGICEECYQKEIAAIEKIRNVGNIHHAR